MIVRQSDAGQWRTVTFVGEIVALVNHMAVHTNDDAHYNSPAHDAAAILSLLLNRVSDRIAEVTTYDTDGTQASSNASSYGSAATMRMPSLDDAMALLEEPPLPPLPTAADMPGPILELAITRASRVIVHAFPPVAAQLFESPVYRGIVLHRTGVRIIDVDALFKHAGAPGTSAPEREDALRRQRAWFLSGPTACARHAVICVTTRWDIPDVEYDFTITPDFLFDVYNEDSLRRSWVKDYYKVALNLGLAGVPRFCASGHKQVRALFL